MAENTSSPDPDSLHQLVLDYLRGTGREQAVERFIEEADIAGVDPDPQDNVDFLKQRAAIRGQILRGDIIAAIETVNDIFPELLDNDIDLFYNLRLQAFVEMLGDPNYNLEEVLTFASEELVPFPEQYQTRFESVMSLLVHNPAQISSITNERETVARKLNDAILRTQGLPEPRLMKLLARSVWLQTRHPLTGSVKPTETVDLAEDKFDQYFN